MILKPDKTFGQWVRKTRRYLKITSNSNGTCHKKTGVYFQTLLNWENEVSLPQTSALLRLVEGLSNHTGESPQDILDTIMESIPEWRRMIGK